MKTKYRYIYFERYALDKRVWLCRSNRTKGQLGTVAYYTPWKRPVFYEAGNDVVFSEDCLRDIADFMAQLGKE